MRLRATARRDALSSIELAVFGITYGQVVQPLPGGPDVRILLLGIWAHAFLRRGDRHRVDPGGSQASGGTWVSLGGIGVTPCRNPSTDQSDNADQRG